MISAVDLFLVLQYLGGLLVAWSVFKKNLDAQVALVTVSEIDIEFVLLPLVGAVAYLILCWLTSCLQCGKHGISC